MHYEVSIMFPRAWGRPRIMRAMVALGKLGLDAVYSVSEGDTDAPCVDTVPMGAESVISTTICAAAGVKG